jgi:amidase
LSDASIAFTPARELVRLIRSRALSAREVMTAFLDGIRHLNPQLNAIVGTLPDHDCLALADDADRVLARGLATGPLHGVPMAIKDLEPAAGLRWTRGSLAFAGDVAAEDSTIVRRLRQAGAIPIGKTNVPEFGMGSQTYNKVYGVTRNPWNLAKTPGGSSGGAAAAVAAGLLPFADGSDFGGSLRNPANFTNVVGFRPSYGLVPDDPNPLPGVGFGVKGPIARSVDDLAWLLSVLAGSDFSNVKSPVRADQLRIAWSPDLGGLPLAPEVRRVLDAQRATFADLGCQIEEAHPDFAGVDEFFLTIRMVRSWRTLGALLEKHRDVIKPEAVWEIECGSRVTGAELATAQSRHAAFLDRMRAFQERYDFIVCAVNQVAPFEVSVEWPHEINGVSMDNYIAWMKSAYWISATFGPAISMPAGFTEDGLPVGIQIAGARGNDFQVLQLAALFEAATGTGTRRPPVAIA